MPLSPQEEQELLQIEGELQKRQSPQQGGLTPQEEQELAQIEGELQKRQAPDKMSEEEASLGIGLRSQYALEPLESNRKALLTQEFGAENVKEDEDGDVYVKQGGVFRPVNAEGFSMADIADFAGSTPEMVGATIGGLAGLGPGTPAGMIAGGAAGSVARQGLSALMGTPQVAEIGERAGETAFSAGASLAGGQLGKWGGKLIKGASKRAKKLFPKLDLSETGKKLAKIAKTEGLPEPTPGQLGSQRTRELEQMVGERPLWGRKIRKQVDEQVGAIKKNLTDIAGDFIEAEPKTFDAGLNIQKVAEENVSAIKKASGDLFKEISETGKSIGVPRKQFAGELLENFQKMGLYDMKGNKLPHNFNSGLSPDQFKRVQDGLETIVSAIPRTATDMTEGTIKQGAQGEFLTVDSINQMRKYIDANINYDDMKPDDIVFKKIQLALMDLTEEGLDAVDPALKSKFQTARALWKKQLDLNTIMKKSGKDGIGILGESPEKVIKRSFTDKKSVQQLKELIGDENTEKAGITYINELLRTKLGGEEQIGARAALKELRNKKDLIIEAIGRKKYRKLANHLEYLDVIGRPFNPSKTFKGALMQLKEIPQGAPEALRYKGRKAIEGAAKTAEEFAETLPGKGRKLGVMYTDKEQREGAYKMRTPSKRSRSRSR